ncbi:MAG TPA: hypothetical protein ACFE0H_04160 [Elainellaceae cyanobacterium]
MTIHRDSSSFMTGSSDQSNSITTHQNIHPTITTQCDRPPHTITLQILNPQLLGILIDTATTPPTTSHLDRHPNPVIEQRVALRDLRRSVRRPRLRHG